MMNKKSRYIFIMILGIIMNQGLSLFSDKFPVWLDTSGTALAALALEPAAGLLVGLVDNFLIAIFKNGSGSLLYYCVSASVAIIVGVIMRDREGRIRWQRIFAVIPLIIIVSTILSSVLTLWYSGGISTNKFELEYYYYFISMGLHPYISCALGIGVIKVYDTIVTAVIVALVYMLIPKTMKNVILKEEQKEGL